MGQVKIKLICLIQNQSSKTIKKINNFKKTQKNV